MTSVRWLFVGSLLALGTLTYIYTGLFVIQPLGMLPEGKTLWIWRSGKVAFVDSADAICEREMGGVSLLCRMSILGFVAKDPDQIIMRLPYSETLYAISTSGENYVH